MATESTYAASDGHRVKFRQDMPPTKGYSKIFWERSYPKTWANERVQTAPKPSARTLGIVYAGTVVYSYYTYWSSKYAFHTAVLRENDQRLGMTPFLLAERDRMILKNAKTLRETEKELMKDHPGWKVGTYYGEPVYYTVGNDRWWDLYVTDHLAHSTRRHRKFAYNWGYQNEYCAPKWYDKYLPQWFLDQFAQ